MQSNAVDKDTARAFRPKTLLLLFLQSPCISQSLPRPSIGQAVCGYRVFVTRSLDNVAVRSPLCSMPQKVAITGVGQTRTRLKRKDVNFTELMGEAVQLALQDAELTPDDIDLVLWGSGPEMFEGVGEPELWGVDQTLGVFKPHYRIQTGGTVGASTTIAGWYMAASGLYDNVLVVSGDKLGESSVQKGLSLVYSPTMGRDFAAGAPSAVANQTRIYMNRFPGALKEEHLARIGTLMRKNALNNPNAQLKLPQITEELMLNMSWLSTPFRLLDSCPTSDAACAMVLQSEKKADKVDRPKAWIQACSTISDGVNYINRDWSDPVALRKASENCYKAVGITNPIDELDVVEIYDAFTSQHVFWYEGLKLAEPGHGPELIENRTTAMNGKLPVNPSGGVLSNNSIGASAMIRQAEVALQLMGRAGDRQVADAEVGLAQGWGGAIQFHTVMIMSREKEIQESFRKRNARKAKG
jgi:acetyl-CoA C-acetyltransferase